MTKVNIDAGSDLVIITKNDIRMIISTPEGVCLHYKNSEDATLITSSTIAPSELFKKIAEAVDCTPQQPTFFRKQYSNEGMDTNNCFWYTQEPQTKLQPLSAAPKIHRGNMSNKELAAWLRSVAKDIESVSAQEEIIPTLTQEAQDARERLRATQLHLSEAFYQQEQDPIQHHGTCDTLQEYQRNSDPSVDTQI